MVIHTHLPVSVRLPGFWLKKHQRVSFKINEEKYLWASNHYHTSTWHGEQYETDLLVKCVFIAQKISDTIHENPPWFTTVWGTWAVFLASSSRDRCSAPWWARPKPSPSNRVDMQCQCVCILSSYLLLNMKNKSFPKCFHVGAEDTLMITKR